LPRTGPRVTDPGVIGGPDPYQYDVFVSYPQRGGLIAWVANVLGPMLEDKLAEAGLLGHPRIFVDTQALVPGQDWPDRLSQAHARSRVIVPVLCAPYFQSGWCTSEWTNAFAREAAERTRAGSVPSLVLPIRFNDLEDHHVDDLGDASVRNQVRARTSFDLRFSSNLVNRLADTDVALSFRAHVERFCAQWLLPAIESAPPWRDDWPRLPLQPISGRDASWKASM
jgi:hypothetical protein